MFLFKKKDATQVLKDIQNKNQTETDEIIVVLWTECTSQLNNYWNSSYQTEQI